ncbi:MAG: hypothetical protein HFACDABA_02348 [Anaerolineales bacterium]|nr:hypothetical protein [Anaerolineales bacterium]
MFCLDYNNNMQPCSARVFAKHLEGDEPAEA